MRITWHGDIVVGANLQITHRTPVNVHVGILVVPSDSGSFGPGVAARIGRNAWYARRAAADRALANASADRARDAEEIAKAEVTVKRQNREIEKAEDIQDQAEDAKAQLAEAQARLAEAAAQLRALEQLRKQTKRR